MVKAIKDNPKKLSFDHLLLFIKQMAANYEIIFTKKSSIKSQLTLRILGTAILDERIMIKQKINHSQWNFKHFKDNSQNILKFKKWYLKKISEKYEVELEDLAIHKLSEGSVDVLLSVNINNSLLKNDRFKASVLPFFESLQLSPDDFKIKFNCKYQ